MPYYLYDWSLHSHCFASRIISYSSSLPFPFGLFPSNRPMRLECRSISCWPPRLGSRQEPSIQQRTNRRRSGSAGIDISDIMSQFPEKSDSAIIVPRYIKPIIIRLRQFDISQTIKLIMPSRTIVSLAYYIYVWRERETYCLVDSVAFNP